MGAKKKDEKPAKFGVYQKKTGSYTAGEVRFTPLTVVPVFEDDFALICDETAPVKFFDDAGSADKNVGALKAQFDKEPKK